MSRAFLFLFQSAVGFEYQGKTEKHASQKGKVVNFAHQTPFVIRVFQKIGKIDLHSLIACEGPCLVKPQHVITSESGVEGFA